MYNNEVEKIIQFIESAHPIFYIQHSDFFAVKEIISEIKKRNVFKEYKFYEYTKALGSKVRYGTPFDDDEDEIEPHYSYEDEPEDDGSDEGETVGDYSDEDETEEDYSKNLNCWLDRKYHSSCNGDKQFLVLKDILSDESKDGLTSVSISYRKEIAEKCVNNGKMNTVIIIAESKPVSFPKELESLLTIIDINPLIDEDIKTTIVKFVNDNGLDCPFIDNSDKLNEFAYPFKGLQQYQIEHILVTLANKNGRKLLAGNDQKQLVQKEKEQFIKKSGILEIISHTESIKKVGGLENLKKYLENKKIVYEDILSAQKFGVELPKGILIAGMPGCGKSLAAKATATLFEVPLVRLDIGSLLGAYIGESEGNLRKALTLSESFSPCVLWIDELEKAFAGISSGGENEGSEVMKRLFGQFLTWMQEKQNRVYIVATANDINSLPPEFLRRGRFDELFFVGFPNEEERKDIFYLKFNSKNKSLDLKSVDFDKLAKETDGYSGSDIESIVNTVVETKFIEAREELKNNPGAKIQLDTDFVLNIVKDKKSNSKMLGDKIKELEEVYKKLNLVPANK